MKITLDLDRLLQEGRITRDEYTRLEGLAAQTTAALALNVLIAFGIVAVAGGTLALLRSAEVALGLGVATGGVGIYLHEARDQRWRPLGVILLLIGALTTGGGVVWLTEGSTVGFAILTVAFAGVALLADSGLLVALSAFALLALLGGMTAYRHAAYFLGVEQPLLTIVVFGLLALATYRVSLVVPANRARLASIFARTSILITNLGFWIGSLWGDRLWQAGDSDNPYVRVAVIPDWSFSIAWAVGLIAAGVWAARRNRRWVVNVVATFGGIHFYTQYFEWLGGTPGSILAAGIVALGIALGLIRYNNPRASAPPEAT
ncbi:MAG: hypothetical protein R3F30_09215 [Planctomycetota bacterium]